jgi:hypothetical protein
VPLFSHAWLNRSRCPHMSSVASDLFCFLEVILNSQSTAWGIWDLFSLCNASSCPSQTTIVVKERIGRWRALGSKHVLRLHEISVTVWENLQLTAVCRVSYYPTEVSNSTLSVARQPRKWQTIQSNFFWGHSSANRESSQ